MYLILFSATLDARVEGSSGFIGKFWTSSRSNDPKSQSQSSQSDGGEGGWEGGGGITWANICLVCAAGLSESLPGLIIGHFVAKR